MSREALTICGLQLIASMDIILRVHCLHLQDADIVYEHCSWDVMLEVLQVPYLRAFPSR